MNQNQIRDENTENLRSQKKKIEESLLVLKVKQTDQYI